MRILRTLAWGWVVLWTTVTGPADAADLVGFRGNGTGVYAAKDVPAQWDVATRANVLWNAPLPERALSEPVMIAGKVLVCCEPEWLVCFDAQTGKELWKAEASVLEGEPADKVTKAKAALQMILDQWKTGEDMPKDKAAPVNVESAWLKKEYGIDPLRNWLFGWQGYAYNTPFSDGKVVWVRYGTGVVACYGLDGKRIWLKRTPARSGLNVQSSQMQVVKGRVVFIESVKPAEKTSPLTRRLTGLDAATGEETWHSKPFPPGDHSDAGGLSLVHTGGNTYLVTSGGQVIDPDTGDIVGQGFGNWGYCSTVYAADGALYFGFQRVRLKAADGKVVSDDPLPAGKVNEAILVYQDRVYLGSQTGFAHMAPTSGPAPDPKTWTRFSFNFKPADKRGRFMPVAAGGLLYCAAAEGRLAVVKPGEKPELVAMNTFPDPITSSPFATDGRLIVRTTKELYCIGKK